MKQQSTNSIDAIQSILPVSSKSRTVLYYQYSHYNDPMTYYQPQQQQQQQHPPQPLTVNNTVISHTVTIPRTTTTTTTVPRSTTIITTLDDLYNVIQECRQCNTLLVVHWSAPWCRSCQRIAPLLHRTIQQLSLKSRTSTVVAAATATVDDRDRRSKIRYVNIPLLYSLSTLHRHPNAMNPTKHTSHPPQHQRNTNLHAMFEIHTVPYCHIYHPINGLVQEFTLTTTTTTTTTKTAIASDTTTHHQRKLRTTTNKNRNNHNPKPTKTISELHQLLETYLSILSP